MAYLVWLVYNQYPQFADKVERTFLLSGIFISKLVEGHPLKINVDCLVSMSALSLFGSSMSTLSHAVSSAKRTISTEMEGLSRLHDVIDGSFVHACELIMACEGRLVVTGMGKSGLIGRKMAATFASTGTPAFFMHPGEAGHGDLGMLIAGDVLLAISNSGESDEIKTLLPVIKRLEIPLISISRTGMGQLPKAATVALTLGEFTEACPLGLAPTTSTTSTLALGDALAVALLEARDFTPEDFALSHPAGSLGKRLLMRVQDLMHQGAEIAQVTDNVSLQDALFEMTSKRLGMTAVLDTKSQQVVGIFTDGDLRRTLATYDSFVNVSIADVMVTNPMTVSTDMMATDALNLMNDKAINQLLVVDDSKRLIGIITLHDLLKAGLKV